MPRISGQILAGAAPQWSHEAAQDDRLSGPARLVDKGEMAFVEVAHGGHQADTPAGPPLGPAPCAELRDGGEFEHGEMAMCCWRVAGGRSEHGVAHKRLTNSQQRYSK